MLLIHLLLGAVGHWTKILQTSLQKIGNFMSQSNNLSKTEKLKRIQELLDEGVKTRLSIFKADNYQAELRNMENEKIPQSFKTIETELTTSLEKFVSLIFHFI